MSVAVSNPTADLWRSIVFVQINFPSGAAYGGTGVMVGPNDVLTASHALYMPHEGGAATSVIVTPANWGQAPFGQVTSNSFQYYTDFDPSNSLMLLPGDGRSGSLAGSERDIGLINLSTPIGYQTGWMKLDPNFSSGNVNVTGFPAAYGWQMVNDYVGASQASVDNVIGYSGIQLNPGNSGGPVWYEGSDGGYVVGVVSTGSWGASVKQVYNDLTSWISGNDYMIAGAPQQAPQPAPQPAPEPAPQPAPEPAPQPAPEPAPQPAPEPAPQPAPEPAPQPAPEPAPQPAPEPAPQPAPEPAPQPPAPQPTPPAQSGHALSVATAATLWDFNGDGAADQLLRNSNGGSLEIRNMNGATVKGTNATGASGTSDWKVKSAGDFNGDGNGDVLWQHDSGLVAIWTMNGSTAVDTGAVAQAPGGARIVGVGDFNGDHKSDILWRADDGTVSTWQMSDHSIVGGGTVGPMTLDWKVSGVGDFNGDGKSDILWRGDDGTVAMWLMDGTSSTLSTAVAQAPTDWRVAGVGDFNGDLRSDIVFQHDSGLTSIWLMDGSRVIGGWGTVTGSEAGWKLAGVGDFNGDQRSDLLWQDAAGSQKVELMVELQVVGVAGVGSIGSDWSVS